MTETDITYCDFVRGNARGIARFDARDAVVAALLDRAACEPVSALGRGALFRFPLSDGHGFLREYRRGGAVQRLLREGSLTNRPLQEWNVLTRLYRAGFPVPEPLGVLWRRDALHFTGAIATRQLDAVDMIAFLNSPAPGRESVLVQAGRSIRAMHNLGVFHADLHVGNLLVSGETEDAKVYFVDFDKARVTILSDLNRAQNLLRMRRSFIKRGLRLTDFERILRGYGPLTWPRWLELLYDTRGSLSDSLRAGSHVR